MCIRIDDTKTEATQLVEQNFMPAFYAHVTFIGKSLMKEEAHVYMYSIYENETQKKMVSCSFKKFRTNT